MAFPSGLTFFWCCSLSGCCLSCVFTFLCLFCLPCTNFLCTATSCFESLSKHHHEGLCLSQQPSIGRSSPYFSHYHSLSLVISLGCLSPISPIAFSLFLRNLFVLTVFCIYHYFFSINAYSSALLHSFATSCTTFIPI